MPKSKLSSQCKIFIIQQLALYERPQAICNMVKTEFGESITINAVKYFDISNPNLPEKWKDIFTHTRNCFLEAIKDIPIAHKSYRLKELDRIYHEQERSSLKNPVELRATLEQAAKEAGNYYSTKSR